MTKEGVWEGTIGGIWYNGYDKNVVVEWRRERSLGGKFGKDGRS